MNVVVGLFVNGEIQTTRKMEEVPAVGDKIVLGKTISPSVYIVEERMWLDSNDEFTRVNLFLKKSETKYTASIKQKRRSK